MRYSPRQTDVCVYWRRVTHRRTASRDDRLSRRHSTMFHLLFAANTKHRVEPLVLRPRSASRETARRDERRSPRAPVKSIVHNRIMVIAARGTTRRRWSVAVRGWTDERDAVDTSKVGAHSLVTVAAVLSAYPPPVPAPTPAPAPAPPSLF